MLFCDTISYRNLASKAACIFYSSEPIYHNPDFFTLKDNSLICHSSDSYSVFILSSVRMINETQSRGYGIQELYINGLIACSIKSEINATNSYKLTELEVLEGDELTAATISGQQGVVVIFK